MCRAQSGTLSYPSWDFEWRKVAVFMPVVTFTDLFFSYWPSRRSLKHLFKRCCIIEMAPKTLECIQKEQDYLSQNVYNPWPGLLNDLDTTKYNATGETLLAADAKSGKHITFYEKEAPNYIFTNMYQRKGQQLVVIDMPDVVSMAPCSEIHI
jgi:hypothetical protein